MDTMTITKTVGAICGALLVLLLGAWASESLYHVGPGEGDEEEVAQGYRIEVADAGAEAAADAAPEVPFEEVYVNASATDGEKLWRQCASCHKLEQGANATGPYLYGVVGRDKGSADGYDYSETLATMEGAWTPENLSNFILNPKEYAPGTKMAYRGMTDIQDRANLIAYLATQQ
ncbi:c-type cytochrome [Jannaschia helgolandensis]|jgi:cytochrome c|uniref:Cytochrome c n=1 Tax=Jannaschia helgolandensis TaxID=188906 RepID=A0A1H7FAJ3_9RHOB|nr:c-type cytochrome [Jannaschia helgolandensis]SEK23079.1 cytochrome c [Jannaschia helgolandensis]|tara:strand:- start:98 stop:622 length:525 start_codon:yes stop_codon:yes gene_type:complete